jgi:endoglucanase
MTKRLPAKTKKARPLLPVQAESLVALVRTLTQAWGPSGYEYQVRDLIRAEVEAYADEITVDPLGNLICRVGQGGKKVMIAAHMDEIGVMVTFVEKKTGYRRFAPVGGLMNTALLGSRVRFEDGTIGTLCMPDYFHGARTAAPAFDVYYIDVSDGSPENDDTAQPGDAAVFWTPLEQRGSRVIAKSLDDRVGCAVAIEAMRRLNRQTPNELYFVFTVQEEVGIRGAKTAAYGVAPDLAIALDVTITGDMIQVEKNGLVLGGGAAIKLQDVGLIVPPAIRDWMIERAEADGVPYQRELLSLGTTDSAAIQTARSGVPSGAISIPCRYVHTTSETVDINDVESCVRLLTGLLANEIMI